MHHGWSTRYPSARGCGVEASKKNGPGGFPPLQSTPSGEAPANGFSYSRDPRMSRGAGPINLPHSLSHGEMGHVPRGGMWHLSTGARPSRQSFFALGLVAPLHAQTAHQWQSGPRRHADGSSIPRWETRWYGVPSWGNKSFRPCDSRTVRKGRIGRRQETCSDGKVKLLGGDFTIKVWLKFRRASPRAEAVWRDGRTELAL